MWIVSKSTEISFLKQYNTVNNFHTISICVVQDVIKIVFGYRKFIKKVTLNMT